MKKRAIVISAILLLMLFIGAIFLYRNYLPKTKEGEKSITVTVVHGDGSSKDFDLQTNSEYLREALEEQDLITGTEGEYGLFITEVDGETADDTRQEWWCITKDGENVNTSADQTPVADQDQFELTLKEGY